MDQTYTALRNGTLIKDDRRHLTMSMPDERSTFAQAYQLLHIAFVLVPLLAGIDKFFNIMTTWEKYLTPLAVEFTGVAPLTLMQTVGIIEIVAAIGIAVKPRLFGYVVSAWLAAIVINLLLLGAYYDVALRDVGLAMAAFALARMAVIYDHHKIEAGEKNP